MQLQATTYIEEVIPGDDTLTERFHRLLAATLDFGGTVVMFAEFYPGDLRRDLEAFAAEHGLPIGDSDHIHATEVFHAGGSMRSVARVYWKSLAEVLGKEE